MRLSIDQVRALHLEMCTRADTDVYLSAAPHNAVGVQFARDEDSDYGCGIRNTGAAIITRKGDIAWT